MNVEEIFKKLMDETDSMWRNNELTTEEYHAARHFIRRFKDEIGK
jgi:hypothetical protein